MTTPPPTLDSGPLDIGQEKASSFLHIRAYPRDKSSWVRSAQRRGLKLAVWVTETLNNKVDDENRNEKHELNY